MRWWVLTNAHRAIAYWFMNNKPEDFPMYSVLTSNYQLFYRSVNWTPGDFQYFQERFQIPEISRSCRHPDQRVSRATRRLVSERSSCGSHEWSSRSWSSSLVVLSWPAAAPWSSAPRPDRSSMWLSVSAPTPESPTAASWRRPSSCQSRSHSTCCGSCSPCPGSDTHTPTRRYRYLS